MPLGSVTLRTGSNRSSKTSRSSKSEINRSKSRSLSRNTNKKNVKRKNTGKVVKKRSNTRSNQSTISILTATTNVKRPGIGRAKHSKRADQKSNTRTVKRPIMVRKKQSRFDTSAVKRPSVSRVIKRPKHDPSIDSEDTLEVYRHNIMSDRIISIHGDSIDCESVDHNMRSRYRCDDSSYDDNEADTESKSFNPSSESAEASVHSDNDYHSEEIIDNYSDSDNDSNSDNDSDSESDETTESTEYSNDSKSIEDLTDSIETINRERRRVFIEHVEGVIEQIKNMGGGDEISVKGDPSLEKKATVKLNNRFDTYIFTGTGCKNLLRIFMKKTVDEEEYGYKRVVQILDEYDFRRFMPINNWRKFWKNYRSEPVRTRRLFEVILSDMPCKPYLDIEWKLTETQLELYGSAKDMDFSDFIQNLIDDIIEIFDTRYNIELDESNIMISSSHSVQKVSFHVVINKVIDGATVTFHTNLRTESGSAWDLCDALIEKDEEAYLNKLDEAVYTTDREFRAIFSNKSTDFRPIEPYAPQRIKLNRNSRVEMDVDDCLKYIITYAKDDKYHLIDVPSYEEDIKKGKTRKLKPGRYGARGMARYSNYASSSTSSSGSRVVNTAYDDIFRFIPNVYDDEEVNRILKLVRKVHPTAQYTGTTRENRWRFTYLDRSEPCYTGNYHDSNGFYVFKNPVSGRIYMKCMSDSCHNQSHTLKSKRAKTYSKKFV